MGVKALIGRLAANCHRWCNDSQSQQTTTVCTTKMSHICQNIEMCSFHCFYGQQMYLQPSCSIATALWLDDLFSLFYSEHCADCWLKMKQYSQKNDKKTHPKLIMDLDKWFDNHHTWFIIYSLFTITLMPLYWDSSVLLCRLYLCALTPFFIKLFWGTLWKENPSNKSCFGGFRDKML